MADRLSAASAWGLADQLHDHGRKAAGRTGTARVTRVDRDGTAWVGIPGGADETPVNGSKVAGVQPGDTVTYRIEGGRLSITGNASDPSVGDRQVERTVTPVRETAQAAKDVVDKLVQFFWHDEAGAHVSSEYGNPVGAQNSVWNSAGIFFRRGVNNLLALVTGNSPGVKIYDGQGNTESHVIASFIGNLIELGKNSTSAVIKLCGGKGVISYRVDSEFDERTLSFVSEDAYVEVESNHAYGNSSQSSAHVGLSSDEYVASANIAAVGDTLGIDRIRRASVGVYSGRPMDSEDSSEYDSGSVVSLYGANVHITDPVLNPYGSVFPMHNLIDALRSPIGTYTGSNSTATASASGWQLTWFNVVISEQGSPRTGYYTFSDGVLTATRDCVLEISGVMNWTDSIAGTRGFGIFDGEVGGSNERSSFQYFSNSVSQRKSVVFPPRLFALSEDDSLYFGRFQQNNAVYQNGTNFSWVTIRVVG